MISKSCDTCRFWSERVAYCTGCGPMHALCLADAGPHKSKYTIGRESCASWKESVFGAIDTPGEEDELKDMYAMHDGAEEP